MPRTRSTANLLPEEVDGVAETAGHARPHATIGRAGSGDRGAATELLLSQGPMQQEKEVRQNEPRGMVHTMPPRSSSASVVAQSERQRTQSVTDTTMRPQGAGSRSSRASRKRETIDREHRLRMLRIEEERARLEHELKLAELTDLSDDESTSEQAADDRTQQWVQLQAPTEARLHETTQAPRPHREEPVLVQPAPHPDDAIARLADALKGAFIHNRNELPIFHGDQREWLAFQAAHEQATRHGDTLQALRQALKGAAREAVAGMLHSGATGSQIFTQLKRKYGHPNQIVATEVQKIRDMPKLSESLQGLHEFACAIQNCFETVRALNHVGYLHSPELAASVLAKLPTLTRIRYAEFAELHDGPELENLARFLCMESDRAMRFTVYAEPKLMKNEAKPNRFEPRHMKKEKTHVTQASNTTECVLCGEMHSSHSCSKWSSLSVPDRWTLAKKKKVCFQCLGTGHARPNCRAKPCGVDGCKRGHHKLLHGEPRQTSSKEECRPSEGEPSGVVATCNTARTAYLKILPVSLKGPKGQVDTLALLDEGSTITLVDRKLAEKIGVAGRTTDLSIATLGGTRRMKSQVISPEIKGRSGSWLRLREARTSDLQLHGQHVPDDVLHKPHLIELADELKCRHARPEVLIGQDNWDLIVTRELRTGESHDPVASRTELGWVLHGRSKKCYDAYAIFNTVETDDLTELIRRNYDLDALGISTKPQRVKHEERAMQILEDTTIHRDGRFEVGLLWKTDNPVFPPSRQQALNRLQSLEKKMSRDAKFAEAYRTQMEHLLEANYAEECSEPPQAGRTTWYLPHFAVKNPNKPGKVRIVFDAAATVLGISLNSRLLPGPDLLQSLLGVIMRYREGRVALTGDIAEMFLQVTIRAEDRDAQRFLWRKKPEDKEPKEYRMKSMLFGAASSPCTALYIKNRNAREAASSPELVRVVEQDHYMDDAITSVDTVGEAKKLLADLSHVHARAGFNIRGWTSNESEVLPERAEGVVKIAGHAAEKERTLDRVPRKVATGEQPPTKRSMLSLVMSVFDPLGLITPITTEAKIILQKVWRSGTDWDEEIPEELQQQWRVWLQNLHQVKNLRVPRHYGTCVGAEAEMHVFCDASLDAYATVAYWRFHGQEGWTTGLIASKSRVAPVKNTSVPRLELQAALIAVRLANTIKKEHRMQVKQTTYWTDSRTVLQWIRKESRNFNQFVAHRLAEIQEETTKKQWRWVPTKLNPADMATRSIPVDFGQSCAWFAGPEFLRREEIEWPATPQVPAELAEEALKEEKAVILATRPFEANEALPAVDRFSSLSRLLQATMTVLKVVERMSKGAKAIEHTPEELWIKEVQRECFQDELKALVLGKTPRNGRLRGLAVFLDAKGIIRLQGRINAADVPEACKNPPILDAGHRFIRLIIEHYHGKFKHANHETVMNELRQRYWILRLRTNVKKIVKECRWCIVQKAKPKIPPTGDLPPARLSHHVRPFTFTGVDYFGPLEVAIGRRVEKRWGALFTCLSTRAVHIEIAHSLSADSMIMALRRMEARRGPPMEIWSDNGTNFVGSNRLLKEAWTEMSTDELVRRAGARGIRWRFIPPGAPSMGGAWERLVRSIKTALHATLKDEVLTTLMAEAEHTVNSRPLVHVSEDPEEEEALTPNHFLLGSSSGAPVRGCFTDSDLVGRSTWKTAQRLADHFWSRWVREYLPSLAPRDPRGTSNEDLQVGDVVVIADGTLPRNCWPRGVIESLHRGPDGHARVAEVRTRGGVVRRPVRRMARLFFNAERSERLTEGENCWRKDPTTEERCK